MPEGDPPGAGELSGPEGPSRAAEPRGPGWREVLLLATAILVAVLLLELASAALPPVREAFRGFPVTIVVLVGGTVGLLVLGARRRPRA